MAATTSTSKPSAVLPFMASNGGNAVSEPATSVPGVTVLTVTVVAAGVVVVLAAGLEQPPMTAAVASMATTRASATNLLCFDMSPPLSPILRPGPVHPTDTGGSH